MLAFTPATHELRFSEQLFRPGDPDGEYVPGTPEGSFFVGLPAAAVSSGRCQ